MTRVSTSALAITIAVVVAVTSAARADTPTPAALAPSPAELAQADSRLAYDRGVRLYDLGDFGGAVVEFKRAYALAETPALLFNIAQCHWQLGAYRDALFLYESYLRAAPHAPNRADVEARIAEIGHKLRSSPVSDSPNRVRLGVGIGVTAIGVVFVASGAALLGRAAGDDHRLATVPPGAQWNNYSRSIEQDRSTSRVGGAVLLSIGVGALVGGTALCVIAFRTKHPAATAARY
jgi:tetratricopeptide (TPR) repeat protein